MAILYLVRLRDQRNLAETAPNLLSELHRGNSIFDNLILFNKCDIIFVIL